MPCPKKYDNVDKLSNFSVKEENIRQLLLKQGMSKYNESLLKYKFKNYVRLTKVSKIVVKYYF
jgi:hypothetical protein